MWKVLEPKLCVPQEQILVVELLELALMSLSVTILSDQNLVKDISDDTVPLQPSVEELR